MDKVVKKSELSTFVSQLSTTSPFDKVITINRLFRR